MPKLNPESAKPESLNLKVPNPLASGENLHRLAQGGAAIPATDGLESTRLPGSRSARPLAAVVCVAVICVAT